MQSKPLPDLRIVPVDKLIPHERHDTQRTVPLVERLRDDGCLKNPPIVAPLDGKNLVVLDGANRVAALRILNLPDALVQVVPYRDPPVQLSTWCHVITGPPAEILYERMAALEGLIVAPTEELSAKAALARRVILAYCLTCEGQIVTLAGGGMDLHERTDLLNQIIDTYIHDWTVRRVNTDNLAEILDAYPHLTAAIVFPRYEPAEILDIARIRAYVPAGITRHIVHGRALRVNYPLSALASSDSVEEKNQKLQRWMQAHFEQNHIRFYGEATYLFDE